LHGIIPLQVLYEPSFKLTISIIKVNQKFCLCNSALLYSHLEISRKNSCSKFKRRCISANEFIGEIMCQVKENRRQKNINFLKNNKVRKIMLALVFYVLYVMSLVISLWIDRFSSYK
jgi:hypothetical protein